MLPGTERGFPELPARTARAAAALTGPVRGPRRPIHTQIKENWQFPHIFFGLSYDVNRLV